MSHMFRMVAVFCAHAIGSVRDHVREYVQKRTEEPMVAAVDCQPTIGMPPVNVYMLRRRKNYELPN